MILRQKEQRISNMPRNLMSADNTAHELPAAEVTAAFKDVTGDFINCAANRSELDLFLSMAMMAWNVSVQGPSETEELIAEFIRRFESPTYRIRKGNLDTREKILELAARKIRFYPELKCVIREAKCQDRSDGLYLLVTWVEAV